MEWIILFAVGWVLFLFMIDWKELKKNIWCGLFACSLQLGVDTQAISHGLYKIENPVIGFMGSSALFVFGPVLVIGTLLAQYYPQKRWLRILHVLAVAALFCAQEVWLVIRKALVYINWHITDSVVVNITAMMVLSWFALIILKKDKEQPVK